MQVESRAARELSDWQAIFAGQTIQRAKELAEKSGADEISVSHFRQAALAAIEGLREVIESKENKDNDRRAA